MNSFLKLLTAIALFSLIAGTSAMARIGETPEELEKRNGPGAESKKSRFPDTTQVKYTPAGWEIYVFFHNGKSIKEQFKRLSGKMSHSEIEEFLKKFSDGRLWVYSRRQKIWYLDSQKNVVVRLEPGHADWLWIEDREQTRKYDKDGSLDF